MMWKTAILDILLMIIFIIPQYQNIANICSIGGLNLIFNFMIDNGKVIWQAK